MPHPIGQSFIYPARLLSSAKGEHAMSNKNTEDMEVYGRWKMKRLNKSSIRQKVDQHADHLLAKTVKSFLAGFFRALVFNPVASGFVGMNIGEKFDRVAIIPVSQTDKIDYPEASDLFGLEAEPILLELLRQIVLQKKVGLFWHKNFRMSFV